jgi:hypothetical protein
MSFVWSEYLDLAKELLGSSSGSPIEETKLRSAISRAYYAVFNEARNYIEVNKPKVIIPDTGGAHKVVPDTLIDDPTSTPDCISVGVNLNRLKANRRLADYKDAITGLPKLTELSVRIASEAIAKLKTL